MKFPKVYVTSKFLDEMDKEAKRIMESDFFDLDEDSDQQRESLTRIKTLFLSSDFQTDIQSGEIEKFRESKFLNFSSFKNVLIRRLVMNKNVGGKPDFKLNVKNPDFEQVNCSFFLGLESKESSDSSEKHGKIVWGKSILEIPFFLKHSFSVEVTSKVIPQARRIAHPCSSLIILDRYLFKKEVNGEDLEKLDNLIKFLKLFIPRKLNNPFEMDIITAYPDLGLIQELEQRISKLLRVKVSLHIYFPPSRIFKESDRYFITDYSITVIGHPLDRESYISTNFIPSNHSIQGVQKGMELWYNKIKKVKDLIDILNADPKKSNFIQKSICPKPKEDENSSSEVLSEHRIFKL